mgnify:CR=1 FL=1
MASPGDSAGIPQTKYLKELASPQAAKALDGAVPASAHRKMESFTSYASRNGTRAMMP